MVVVAVAVVPLSMFLVLSSWPYTYSVHVVHLMNAQSALGSWLCIYTPQISPADLAVIPPVLFCFLADLDPMVCHTMDVLSPFISVLCHSDWLFHGQSCPRMMLSIYAVRVLPRLRAWNDCFTALNCHHHSRRCCFPPVFFILPHHCHSLVFISSVPISVFFLLLITFFLFSSLSYFLLSRFVLSFFLPIFSVFQSVSPY